MFQRNSARIKISRRNLATKNSSRGSNPISRQNHYFPSKLCATAALRTLPSKSSNAPLHAKNYSETLPGQGKTHQATGGHDARAPLVAPFTSLPVPMFTLGAEHGSPVTWLWWPHSCFPAAASAAAPGPSSATLRYCRFRLFQLRLACPLNHVPNIREGREGPSFTWPTG